MTSFSPDRDAPPAPPTPAIQIVHTAALRTQPWANGTGQTRVIRDEAAHHDDGWRLSLATIDSPGPFSFLPGYERHLLVLSSDPITIRVDGVQRTLAQFAVVSFVGGAPVEVTHLSRRTLALNLMTRPGVQGNIEIADIGSGSWTPRHPTDAVVLLDGGISVRGQDLSRYDVILNPDGAHLHCRDARVARIHLTTRTQTKTARPA